MKYKVMKVMHTGGSEVMRVLNEFYVEESARLFAKNYIKYAVPNQIDRDVKVKIIKEL